MSEVRITVSDNVPFVVNGCTAPRFPRPSDRSPSAKVCCCAAVARRRASRFRDGSHAEPAAVQRRRQGGLRDRTSHCRTSGSFGTFRRVTAHVPLRTTRSARCRGLHPRLHSISVGRRDRQTRVYFSAHYTPQAGSDGRLRPILGGAGSGWVGCSGIECLLRPSRDEQPTALEQSNSVLCAKCSAGYTATGRESLDRFRTPGIGHVLWERNAPERLVPGAFRTRRA